VKDPSGDELKLPDPDIVRARIDALDEERGLLRKLLRTIIRIEGRKAKTSVETVEAGASNGNR
jgi:hypothetical protein